MADNVNIRDFGNNSIPVASDEVSGAQFQVVKVAFGEQDTAVYASSSSPLPVSAIGSLTYTELQNPPPMGVEADYTPGYANTTGTPTVVKLDPDGNMKFRGSILTDEGSYRTNFANTSLAVTIGNCTFTSGSDIVTGVDLTNLAKDMHKNVYVYLTVDTQIYARQVAEYNDTTITLVEPYSGPGGTGPASRQILNSKVGSGITFDVANGVAVASMGTTSGSIFELERDVDILPLIKQTDFSLSQRILNQNTNCGFYDDTNTIATPRYFAWFVIDGTDSTKIRCESARNPTTAPSASEIQSTIVNIPNSKTTMQSMRYKVELLFDRANFWLDGILVAQHFKSLPLPDDLLTSVLRCTNTGTTASSTSLSVDYDSCRNYSVVDVYNGQDTITTTTPSPVGGELLIELTQTLEQLAMTLQSLGGLGEAKDPVAGRLRVSLDSIAGSLTLGTVTTVGTVSTITGGTITTLTGQTNIGGIPANDQIPSLMNMVAQNMILQGVNIS